MTPRLLAQIVAAGRVLVGLILFVAPARVTRHWVGPVEGDRTGTKVMAMGLGARDVVIGAGALAAISAGNGAAKPWLLGSAAADLCDLASTVRSAGDLPKGAVTGTIVVAGGAAAAGIYVLTRDV